MKEEPRKEKTRYQMIRDGEIKPEGSEAGWLNLEKRVSFGDMPLEKRREAQRKGAEAVNRLHGEKKTAREALGNILSLKVTDEIIQGADIDAGIVERLRRDNPEATMYDLIQAVAVGRAVSGNVKAMEYVRDTNGDKPVDKIDATFTGQIITDADREMIQAIHDRLQAGDHLEIIRDV